MNLTLSIEQNQLRDSVARFVADHGVHGALAGEAASGTDFRRDLWKNMAELGWLGAGLSEEEGGFGGGPVETMIVIEEIGRGLMPEPFLPAVVAARLLAAAQPGSALLAALVAGEELIVPVLDDEHSGEGVRLSGDEGARRLSGRSTLVVAGGEADRFIVSCTMPDGAPALVAIAANAAGGGISGYRTLDGRHAATVTFADAPVPEAAILARGEEAAAALAAARQVALAALCAEVLGVAEFLFAQTLDYLKTRRQFGQPIGRFQALQHRMADMFVALEEARSLALMATVRLASGETGQIDRDLSAAKIGAVARALHIGREAIQLHGGVGMTQELPIGAGFKRIKALELMFGDENHHLDRMAASMPSAA